MTTDSTLHPPRSPHAPATIPSKALRTYLTPLLILFGIVIASGAQTEVAHNLTSSLGYNQPYFTFYLTHVTFSLIFPVHLLLLYLLRPVPISRYIDGLRHVIADQLGEPDGTPWRVIAKRWSWKVTWLTCLVTVPALAWFAAMVYSPAMDITAIYATSSFHAYFFSMLLLKQPLSRTTAGSIALAFAGVIVLSLAGTEGGGEDDQAGGSNRFFGDIVMMGGRSDYIQLTDCWREHGV
jgi:drug/metabolite transporter (DMT)-like permease